MPMRLQKGPARRRPLAAVAVVAAASVAAGVTLGEGRHAEAAALPACGRLHAAALHPALLASFPVPRGTAIVARADRYGYAIFRGRVPGRLVEVRDRLLRSAPAAGYRVTGGDAELTEAEASFLGHGAEGRWKLRELPGCRGALTFEIAIRR